MFGVPNSRFVAFFDGGNRQRINLHTIGGLSDAMCLWLHFRRGSAETTTAIVGILSASPNTVGEMPHHLCDVDAAHVPRNPGRVNHPSDQIPRCPRHLFPNSRRPLTPSN